MSLQVCPNNTVRPTGNLAWLADRAEVERAEAERRVEEVAARAALAAIDATQPWLDKRALAAHLACSVRWIELRMKDGLPHVNIAGRVKFKASGVEDWLAASEHIQQRGEDSNE